MTLKNKKNIFILYLIVIVVANTVEIVDQSFDFEHVQFHGRQVNGDAEEPHEHHQVHQPLEQREHQ